MAIHAPITGAPSRAPSNDKSELPPCRDAWQSTVATWRVAREKYVSHPRAKDRRIPSLCDDLEREADELREIEGRALDAVMNMIAPDHSAVLEKLEIIKAEFSDDYYIDCLIADVRHLRDRAVWDDLMVRYLAAKATEDDYAVRIHDPLFEGNPCTDTQARKTVADEMDRLTGIRCDLRNELLGATAPDQAALLWKLEYLLTDTDAYCWSDETVSPVLSDVRLILGQSAKH